MPLGIISDSDFESELSNCSLPVITQNSFDSPLVSDNPSSIPTTNNSDSKSDLIEPRAEVINIKHGRGNGNIEVPEALRKIIGETSVINGRSEALDLASMMGIKPSSVSAYKEGAHSTSTINSPDIGTLNHINNSKERVVKRATKKLHLALSHITEDKLMEAKVGELASVAKSMSGIIKDMEPENEKTPDELNAPKFLIYAPQIKNENNYEVIHSRE